MKSFEKIYTPEKQKQHLGLTEEQRKAVRSIIMGIEEVDETIRAMTVEDVIRTLENGHPLNRIITGPEGKTQNFIACEDFIPNEAYIKYFCTTGLTGRSLFLELPAFLNTPSNTATLN